MAQTPLRSPLDPAELAAIFGGADDADLGLDKPTAPARARGPRRVLRSINLTERVRRLPHWAFLLAGLLIGWLVIGWWLWPIHWSNSDPWEMSAKNQKIFVQLVADRYWTDRDLAQAEATLNGWNHADVNSLLVTLQAETIDVAVRQHLDALSKALNLPGGEQSLLASIFNQDGIIFALIIATLPMLIAIGLVVSSQLHARSADATGEAPATDDQEADLEELLADVQLEEGQTGGPGPGGAEATGEQPDQTAAPGEQQPGEAEATGEEEEEKEETLDANNPLGDLASLFAEEDTSVALLETMSKGLPEIPVDELLTKGRDMLRRFREERPKR